MRWFDRAFDWLEARPLYQVAACIALALAILFVFNEVLP